jgi:hypothetical protein
LTLPVVSVDHDDGPDRRGNPSHHGELEAQAKRRFEDVPSQKQGKPRKQHGYNNYQGDLLFAAANWGDLGDASLSSNRVHLLWIDRAGEAELVGETICLKFW